MKNFQRRSLIRSIACVPVWSAPFVQSVILPAHAQTSIVADPLVTDAEQDGAFAARRDASSITFNGEIPITFDSSLFNCCNSSSVPNTSGNRLFIIDYDLLTGGGCRGPFIDFSDDINGLTKTGDTNWEVNGLERKQLSPGVYDFEAVRLNSPNKGMRFVGQIDFNARVTRVDRNAVDCDGQPLIREIDGSVDVTLSVEGSLQTKSMSIKV